MAVVVSAMTMHPLRGAVPAAQMYYELRVYRINGPVQEAAMDKYLKDAYIPAAHRAGISNIGVFKPIEKDTAFGKMIYVLVPFKTYDEYFTLASALESDKEYYEAGKEYIDAVNANAPFVRYESVLAKAFAFMPQMFVPTFTTPKSERIYELRSYESGSEGKALNKIHMFNEGGEIQIFEKIGANAVFYAQVLLGSQKPRLIYLTTYADMKTHDACWAAFRAHPDWKALSSKEEYKGNTSKTKAFLCHPAEYSDF